MMKMIYNLTWHVLVTIIMVAPQANNSPRIHIGLNVKSPWPVGCDLNQSTAMMTQIFCAC